MNPKLKIEHHRNKIDQYAEILDHIGRKLSMSADDLQVVALMALKIGEEAEAIHNLAVTWRSAAGPAVQKRSLFRRLGASFLGEARR